MKATATFLCMLLATAPVFPAEAEGNVITLSDEEVKICADSGGCVVITMDKIKDVVSRLRSCEGMKS